MEKCEPSCCSGQTPSLATVPDKQQANRAIFRIEQMDCPTEEALLRKALGNIAGVRALEFSLMDRMLIADLGREIRCHGGKSNSHNTLGAQSE